jgi:site-specific DNA recombinase
MARVLIAARLSQLVEAGPSRLDRDDTLATDWANAEGHEVVMTTADVVSGKSDPFKRAGLGPWLTRPELIAQWDVLVVSKLDRLSRSVRYLDRVKEWAEVNGKRIVILDGFGMKLEWPVPENGSGSLSRFMWQLVAWFAEEELITITERQAGARATVKTNGAYVGKPGFGFMVIGEKYNRTITPVPELVDTLRELVRRATRGDTNLALAKWMDTQVACKRIGKEAKGKLVTGWTPTSIQGVLANTALRGMVTCSSTQNGVKSTWQHHHTPLITNSEWAALQAARASRAVKGHKRGERETAMLTGIIFCTKCNGAMYRVSPSTSRADGTKNTIEYYRCKGSDNAPSKCRNMVRLDEVEDFVDRSFRTDAERFAGREIKEQRITAGDDHATEIADLMTALGQLDPMGDDDRRAALRDEVRILQGMPVEPSSVELVATGRTVGHYWASLETQAERRRYLLASKVRVMAVAGEYSIEGNPAEITQPLSTIAA